MASALCTNVEREKKPVQTDEHMNVRTYTHAIVHLCFELNEMNKMEWSESGRKAHTHTHTSTVSQYDNQINR